MRLADSFRSERFGAVRIHELQRVIELDSGTSAEAGSRIVPPDALRAIESQMVIVVPCMNETRSVIEGVLSGIPHDCLIVLVGLLPVALLARASRLPFAEGARARDEKIPSKDA